VFSREDTIALEERFGLSSKTPWTVDPQNPRILRDTTGRDIAWFGKASDASHAAVLSLGGAQKPPVGFEVVPTEWSASGTVTMDLPDGKGGRRRESATVIRGAKVTVGEQVPPCAQTGAEKPPSLDAPPKRKHRRKEPVKTELVEAVDKATEKHRERKMPQAPARVVGDHVAEQMASKAQPSRPVSKQRDPKTGRYLPEGFSGGAYARS
jgi:hypothetical protein